MNLFVFQRTAVTEQGNVIPNAEITVYAAGTTTEVDLFDDAGGTPKGNPFNAGPTDGEADGFIQFYVAFGQYDIAVNGVVLWENQTIGRPELSDITSLSSLNTAALVDGQQFSVIDKGTVRTFKFDSPSSSFVETYSSLKGSVSKGIIPSRTSEKFWWRHSPVRVLEVAWRHGNSMLKVTIAAATSNNGLATITDVSVAPWGDPETATWTTVLDNSSGGDFFPPRFVSAVNNNDGTPSSSREFTGGSHQIDGNPTAELNAWIVDADGVPRSMLGDSGWASEIELFWSASVQAYNTSHFPDPEDNRYVLQEFWSCIITAGGIEATCRVSALEDIEIERDYGIQLKTEGYRDAIHLWGGEGLSEVTSAQGYASQTLDSGRSDEYFTARVMVARGAEGFMSSWMDPSYGVGDGSLVATATQPFMLVSQLGKGYHRAVEGIQGSTAHLMSPGQNYQYRGGWSWAPSNIVVGGTESAFRRTISGRPQYVSLVPSQSTANGISPRQPDIGRNFVVESTSVEPAGALNHKGMAMVESDVLNTILPGADGYSFHFCAVL